MLLVRVRQKDAERRREDAVKREREAQKRIQRKQAYQQVHPLPAASEALAFTFAGSSA